MAYGKGTDACTIALIIIIIIVIIVIVISIIILILISVNNVGDFQLIQVAQP